MDEFVRVMLGSQPSITPQLHEIHASQIAKNRQKIKSIVGTIILCGRQNIPLRGHHDSMTDWEFDNRRDCGHYCSFVQQQVTLFFVITLHMLLEMPCIHLLIYKIKSSILSVIAYSKQFSIKFNRHNPYHYC